MKRGDWRVLGEGDPDDGYYSLLGVVAAEMAYEDAWYCGSRNGPMDRETGCGLTDDYPPHVPESRRGQ